MLFITLIIVSVVFPKTAVTGDGHYLAGYANASFDGEFDLDSCPETIKRGVITVVGEDLTDGGREKIEVFRFWPSVTIQR
jgi:hypothetical protein